MFSKLKVAEVMQDDVNKGIVRIDPGVLKEIDVDLGEPVEIKSYKKITSIAKRAYPGDIGLKLIRIDENTRKKAGVSIGDEVSVKKVD